MANANCKPLAELKTLYRIEQQARLKKDYDAKKAAKRAAHAKTL